MPTYHRVFISHAHTDNTICKQYADALRAKGIDVWIDLTNAQQGHDLSEEIARELRERTAFVLMVTTASNESHWVRQERSAFNKLMNTHATHFLNGVERMILPVRLNDEVPTLFDGIFWVDAFNQPIAPTVDRIATALMLSPVDRRDPPPPPPPNDRDEIGIPESLYRLGFRGWRMRRTGISYIEPPTCPVAAGMFVMGSAESDAQAFDFERPQYRIPVAAFSIGKYPVTVEEYRYFLRANPSKQDLLPSSYTFPKDAEWCAPEWRGKELSWAAQQTRPDHPVVCLTWFNATAYAAWLAHTTGQPWRLPTEAEWEKAARWDETKQVSRIYPWGDTWDKTRANTYDGGPKRTTAVGNYPTGASPYGAQDMAGNVWEWTSSLYKEHYPYDPSASEDDGKNRTDVRVLRGGSWGYDPRIARAACRSWDGPGGWGLSTGARVCLRAAGT